MPMVTTSQLRPFVSVVIPAYNEQRYIRECLDSVFAQDYPSDRVEVIVVDGHSTDGTAGVVRSEYPRVMLLENRERIVPISMNMGVRAARGEYIVRLDVHARYPSTYISYLIANAKELGADNVGVCCKTLPANGTSKARAIAIALSTRFGMGDSQFRLGVDRIKEVDTVPFGCYRREVFDEIGLYDEELIRNQDDELNARLIKHGGKIFLLPGLEVEYYARGSVGKLARMFYQYGLFKPLANRKVVAIQTVRQLVPLFFVAYLVALFVLLLFRPSWFFIPSLPLLLYLLLDSVCSACEARKGTIFLWLMLVYPVVHVSYGVGYWHGVLKNFLHLPYAVTSSR